MLEPVRKTRLSQGISEQLARLILSGRYPPGTRLPPERELASRLAVTRTSLREALRGMEGMGLVTVRPGDGVYVEDHRSHATLDFVRFALSAGLPLEPELLLSMEEARRLLAVQMIRLAAERITPEGLQRLEAVAVAFPEGPSPELLSGDWDFRFFREIARATGNRVFVYMLNSVRDLFLHLRWIYAHLDAQAGSVAALNRQVVEALGRGESERAVRLVEERMQRDAELLAEVADGGGSGREER